MASLKSKERNRQFVETLKAVANDPREVAKRMLHIVNELEDTVPVTDTTTTKDVVITVGNLLTSKRLLKLDVIMWAKRLYQDAELSFEVDEALIPGADISQPTATADSGAILMEEVRSKKARRPYLPLAEQLLTEGNCTRDEFIAAIHAVYPQTNVKTLYTAVSDLLGNGKYSWFSDRAVIMTADKKLAFASHIVNEPVPEEVPEPAMAINE